MFLAFIGVIGGAVAWVYALLLPVGAVAGLLHPVAASRLVARSALAQQRTSGAVGRQHPRRRDRSAPTTPAGASPGSGSEITASIDRYAIQQRAISSSSTVTTSSLSTLAYVCGGGGRCVADRGRPADHGRPHRLQHSRWTHHCAGRTERAVHGEVAARQPVAEDGASGARGFHPSAATNSWSLPDEDPDFDCARGSPLRLRGLADPTNSSSTSCSSSRAIEFCSSGPVGSGKSTLLKVLAGLYRPSEGRCDSARRICGRPIRCWSAIRSDICRNRCTCFAERCAATSACPARPATTGCLQVSRQLGIDAIAAGNPQGMDLSDQRRRRRSVRRPATAGGSGARIHQPAPHLVSGRTHGIARQRNGGARVADARERRCARATSWSSAPIGHCWQAGS